MGKLLRPHQTSLEKVVCSLINTSDGYFYFYSTSTLGNFRCTCFCWGGVPPLWCRRSHLEDQLAMLEVWTVQFWGYQIWKDVPDIPSIKFWKCWRVNNSWAKLRSPFPLKCSICWIFLGVWRHVLGEWEDYFPFLVGYDMWWYISRMPNIAGLQMSPLHIFSTKPHMMPRNLNQYFPRFGFDSEPSNMQPWTWMAFASCFVNYDVGFKHIVSPKAGNLSSTVRDIFELNLIDPKNPIDHSFASVRCCKFLGIHEVLTCIDHINRFRCLSINWRP